MFAFAIALVVWVAGEIKLSEEFIEKPSSQNDVRLGREIIEMHTGDVRSLLKDTDLFQFVDERIYDKVFNFLSDFDRGKKEFQNRRLGREFDDFVEGLKDFSRYVAIETVPVNLGGSLCRGFKPEHTVTEEEYERQKALSKKANDLADLAWGKLDALAARVKIEIPEVLDHHNG